MLTTLKRINYVRGCMNICNLLTDFKIVITQHCFSYSFIYFVVRIKIKNENALEVFDSYYMHRNRMNINILVQVVGYRDYSLHSSLRFRMFMNSTGILCHGL